jgi:hypothetical protein
MSIIVFTGPTIEEARARDVLAADYRPPARVGDVLAAALSGPVAIAIIDGLFDAVPAIWHKEILFALSQGIHVYGASSMGALRAAELHTFGMVGVGRIFEMYRDGVLEDDDEVAVVHRIDGGRAAQSEAMVNIRAGLDEAVQCGVIGPDTRDDLTRAAKTLHYPDRSWPALISHAKASGALSPTAIAGFREFLATHDTNLKRHDAVALLHRVAADHATGMAPFRPAFTFERTTLFEALRETVTVLDSGEIRSDVLAIVTKAPDAAVLTRHALLLSLAAAEIRRRGIDIPIGDRLEHEERFLAERGLGSADTITAWLADNQLTIDGFQALVHLEACVERLVRDRGTSLDPYLIAVLQRDGQLVRVIESLKVNRPSTQLDNPI